MTQVVLRFTAMERLAGY